MFTSFVIFSNHFVCFSNSHNLYIRNITSPLRCSISSFVRHLFGFSFIGLQVFYFYVPKLIILLFKQNFEPQKPLLSPRSKEHSLVFLLAPAWFYFFTSRSLLYLNFIVTGLCLFPRAHQLSQSHLVKSTFSPVTSAATSTL